MIPFYFKQVDYVDPDVIKGYNELNAIALRVSGLYPNLKGHWYYIYGVYVSYIHISYVIYVLSFVMSIYYSFVYKDRILLVANLSVGILTFIYCVVAHIILYRRPLIDYLFKITGLGFFKYERPLTSDEEEILRQCEEDCKKSFYRNICLAVWLSIFTLFIYPLPHGLRGKYTTVVDGGVPVNKHLNIPIWIPIETGTAYKFWLANLVIAHDGMAECALIGSSCSLYCNLCIKLAAQLQLLSHSLRDLHKRAVYSFKTKTNNKVGNNDLYGDVEFQKCLNDCLIENITHYQILLEFHKTLQKFVAPAIFAIFSGTAITISAPMYRLLVLTDPDEDDDKLTQILTGTVHMYTIISFMMFLASYCLYGQLVTNQSEKLHHSLYQTPWRNADRYFKTNIIITMAKCKRPLILSAWGLVDASSKTLLDIVKTVFSYFNLLTAFN